MLTRTRPAGRRIPRLLLFWAALMTLTVVATLACGGSAAGESPTATLEPAPAATPTAAANTGTAATPSPVPATPPAPSSTPPPGATAGTFNIEITKDGFSPAAMTVPSGSTVVWTNKDSMPHSVTSDAWFFNSGNIDPGATFTLAFTLRNTFSYHCMNQPDLKAKITVE